MEERHYWHFSADFQKSDQRSPGKCEGTIGSDKKQLGQLTLKAIRDGIAAKHECDPMCVVINSIAYLGYMTAEEFENA